VADSSVYLEEYARGQIGAEEMHLVEMQKLLRDYAD
jgi:bacterioferritin